MGGLDCFVDLLSVVFFWCCLCGLGLVHLGFLVWLDCVLLLSCVLWWIVCVY